MLVSHIVTKPSPYSKVKKIFIACISIIGLVLYFYGMELPSKDRQVFSQTTVPLLLNSGEVQSKEAEVSIILWFEDGNIPHGAWTKRPMQDWIWKYDELQTGGEKVTVTLSGSQMINKNEESNLYKWYTTMQQELAKTGGLIYIDERVDQAMDISSYLSNTNALPAQWALVGNMVSIAAFQNFFLTSVIAGQDRINIQLLSRGKNTEGRTVLAIPALLQEF
ncbi:MAG: hypothetical protein APF81_16030 [Desulfosporosinus sp. BRH_c37]|nr:MAG: hypothetical protein APF81_16030 [Desulfosporosinus sp. BRH_c37]